MAQIKYKLIKVWTVCLRLKPGPQDRRRRRIQLAMAVPQYNKDLLWNANIFKILQITSRFALHKWLVIISGIRTFYFFVNLLHRVIAFQGKKIQ